MAWRRIGGKPLHEPMMDKISDIYDVTRPQYFNTQCVAIFREISSAISRHVAWSAKHIRNQWWTNSEENTLNFQSSHVPADRLAM